MQTISEYNVVVVFYYSWKTCLWPVIPDAANSSIKKWTSDLLVCPLYVHYESLLHEYHHYSEFLI